MLDLRRTEKTLKQGLELLKGCNDPKQCDQRVYSLISGVQNLVNKFKWIHSIASTDDDTLACLLYNDLQKSKKYLNLKKLPFDAAMSEYLTMGQESGNMDYTFVISIEIILLTDMSLMAYVKPNMPKSASDIFWGHFAVATQMLDMLIVPAGVLNGTVDSVEPTIYDLRDQIEKYIENRKRGGIKTAEKYKPLKDWCITRAYEIRDKHPSKSKEQIVMQLLVEMRDKKSDSDVMQLTETNARHTIKNKWLPRGKPNTWSDL